MGRLEGRPVTCLELLPFLLQPQLVSWAPGKQIAVTSRYHPRVVMMLVSISPIPLLSPPIPAGGSDRTETSEHIYLTHQVARGAGLGLLPTSTCRGVQKLRRTEDQLRAHDPPPGVNKTICSGVCLRGWGAGWE